MSINLLFQILSEQAVSFFWVCPSLTISIGLSILEMLYKSTFDIGYILYFNLFSEGNMM
jgi:hypothetical protein